MLQRQALLLLLAAYLVVLGSVRADNDAYADDDAEESVGEPEYFDEEEEAAAAAEQSEAEVDQPETSLQRVHINVPPRNRTQTSDNCGKDLVVNINQSVDD